tara:strand:+ start:439 stop:705 length:267 start_codon:yes stop_codon:yes gene_type:complete
MVGIKRVRYTTQGEAYIISREIRAAQLKNPDYSILKEYFHCDSIIQNDGKLFFCNKIDYVKFEEVTEDTELIDALNSIRKTKKVKKKR